ncbi:flagellar assembly protein A [Clostridium sp. BJN0013]|uniref:flagellar assembly protein A n=1 Tax=Clostridium sp. BJN0013 TaxID=3236840 RepID=UPI0034C5B3F8
MKKVFQGTSLENCLQLARYELNIPEDKFGYKVLENKKSFFRRKVTIEVTYDDMGEGISKEQEGHEVNKNQGTVKVVEGRIIVKDPLKEEKPAVIVKGDHMSIFVDGDEIKRECEVLSSSNIEVILEENEPKRELKIDISEDAMEAYAGIAYTSRNVYALKDTRESNRLNLDTYVVETVEPPKYTANDIKNELANNKIVYGIMEENFKDVLESGKRVLIAKGKKAVDGQDDVIDINFQDSVDLKEDMEGNVDFKSIGIISTVKKGDIIAERHRGFEGENGFDVKGKTLKFRKAKHKKLAAGQGCMLKDEDKVEAVIEGKPFIKNGTFYIHQVHEISKDVDLSTGNIKFTGDIIVQGNVREGMEIECGGNLIIYKEVERAKIKARGDILINGSIVGSDIYGGGDCVNKIKSIDHLVEFNINLGEMIEAITEIKTYDLLGKNKKDGEIIKILLENKFKGLLKLGINIIADLNIDPDECEQNLGKEIVKIIRTRFMGMGPISITNYSELSCLKEKIEAEIEHLSNCLALPVNLTIAYCQDSHIESSGSVIITGKGEYISEITANESIEFLQERSVARGGTLKAKKEIKCKIVGSMAGVSTILHVEDEGHIWADVAYHNTVIKVGKKKVMLDTPSKNLHAYSDKGNIVVDKFLL